MLNFPNPCRSYDATRHCVRFWGHDGALEVSFFIDDDALIQIGVGTTDRESSLLQCFDANRGRIMEAARKIYRRRSLGSYELMASDF
jgi:hypothetical protein